MHKIFVYGTLKQGKSNHRFLEGYEPKRAKAPGIILFDGRYFPYAQRGCGIAKGELYEVDSFTLAKLDKLEGHPTHYKRELTPVFDSEMKKVDAWIYLTDRKLEFPKIQTGEWVGN